MLLAGGVQAGRDMSQSYALWRAPSPPHPANLCTLHWVLRRGLHERASARAAEGLQLQRFRASDHLIIRFEGRERKRAYSYVLVSTHQGILLNPIYRSYARCQHLELPL